MIHLKLNSNQAIALHELITSLQWASDPKLLDSIRQEYIAGKACNEDLRAIAVELELALNRIKQEQEIRVGFVRESWKALGYE